MPAPFLERRRGPGTAVAAAKCGVRGKELGAVR